jgi:Holliday junction resolvase
MTPEAKIKKKVTALLKARDLYFFFPATHGYGSSGVPDIVACCKGRFVGIEVKANAKKNPPTALQRDNLARIEANGGVAVVVDEHGLDYLAQTLEALCS